MGRASMGQGGKDKQVQRKGDEEKKEEKGAILTKSVDLKCDVFVSYCWADKRIVLFPLDFKFFQFKTYVSFRSQL